MGQSACNGMDQVNLWVEYDESHQDEHAIGFHAHERHCRVPWKKACENSPTVQWRKRQQIEQHQEHVNQDGVDRHHRNRQEEHLVPGVLWVGIFRLGPVVADCWVDRQQEREEEGAADGQREIHGWPCRCNERHVSTRLAHGAWVDRNRLGPAQEESPRYQQANQRQDNGSEWIDVSQWVHGEPTLELGRRIAAPIGNPTMGIFVQDHCEKEWEPHVGNRVEDLG